MGSAAKAMANEEPGQDLGTITPEDQRPLLQCAADFLFGYDYFISYAWSDGRAYAAALTRELEGMGFECFLDSEDYAKGDNWRMAGRRAIRKTARLILVGSPGALDSEPVLREFEAFEHTGRLVVPIDFGGSLFPAERTAPLFQHLQPETLAIREASDRLAAGPSLEALKELRASFDLQRQDRKRIRWLVATAVVLAVLLVASVVASAGFVRQQQEAERQRDLAVARNLAFEASENSAKNPRTAARQFLSSLELLEATKTASGLFKLLRDDPHIAMRQLQPPFPVTAAHMHMPASSDHVILGLENGDVLVWTLQPEGSIEGEVVLAEAQSVKQLRGDGRRILLTRYDEEAREVVALDDGGLILRWALSRVDATLTKQRAFSGKRGGELWRDEGPAAALSEDGRAAVWLSEEEGLLYWVEGREAKIVSHDLVLDPVALSGNGHLLAYQGQSRENQRVQVIIYDLERSEKIDVKNTPIAFGGVTALAFDRQGRRLAAGFHMGAILLWDLQGAESTKGLVVEGEGGFGIRGPVRRLALSGDGAYLASFHQRSWQIWDAKTGSDFAELPGQFEPVAAFDGSGERLLLVPEGQGAQVVDYSLQNLRDLGCRLAAVNFSREEWRKVAGDTRYVCPCPHEPGCDEEGRADVMMRYEIEPSPMPQAPGDGR